MTSLYDDEHFFVQLLFFMSELILIYIRQLNEPRHAFLALCSFVVFGIADVAALIVSCCLHFLVLFFGGTSLETVWLRMKYLVTLLLLSQTLAFSAFSTSL